MAKKEAKTETTTELKTAKDIAYVFGVEALVDKAIAEYSNMYAEIIEFKKFILSNDAVKNVQDVFNLVNQEKDTDTLFFFDATAQIVSRETIKKMKGALTRYNAVGVLPKNMDTAIQFSNEVINGVAMIVGAYPVVGKTMYLGIKTAEFTGKQPKDYYAIHPFVQLTINSPKNAYIKENTEAIDKESLGMIKTSFDATKTSGGCCGG